VALAFGALRYAMGYRRTNEGNIKQSNQITMQVQGTIKRVNAEQVVSDKFRKRTAHIEVKDGEYSQVLEIQFTQDKCDLLNAVAVGQLVTVDINLRGREWTGNDGVLKVFNTLEGWKVTSEAAPTAASPIDEADDLPF
jgi:hypothetical protein